MFDLAIIGAGPVGLEAAIRAKRAGLSYVLIEAGCIVDAVYHWPTYVTFFTTADRLEVGNHPMVTAGTKPTRKEALDYYRKVAHNEDLNVKLYTRVTNVQRSPQGFELTLRPDRQPAEHIQARKVAVATGYYENPKLLGIPGEEQAHVSHYFTEAHPFWRRNVTIIGAGSSAADAALDLYRAGAQVTMIHRGGDFRHSLKYWVRPDLENRVEEGSIKLYLHTVAKEITPTEVIVESEGETFSIPTDMTFALTGYYAAPEMVEGLGVDFNPEDGSVSLNDETLESNVSGLYFIGSSGFGARTSDVFIENGLVHAQKALDDIVRRLESVPA